MSEITSFSFPYNYVLFCALLAWACAQTAKFILDSIVNKQVQLKCFMEAGGMPSGHSAMVCGLAMAIGKSAGVSSPEFAIGIVLAAIVMYDAVGVRRSSGEQAKLLNRLLYTLDLPELKQVEIKKKLRLFSRSNDAFDTEPEEEDEEIKKLKEKQGHTPLEVLGGAIIGIVIPLLIPIA